MCARLPDIMATLYACTPTRYNDHTLCVHAYQIKWPHSMCARLPDIMATLYVCTPTRYNGHTLCVYSYQVSVCVYLPGSYIMCVGIIGHSNNGHNLCFMWCVCVSTKQTELKVIVGGGRVTWRVERWGRGE